LRQFATINYRIVKGSFDHIVGAGEDRQRNGKPERNGGLEVDYYLVPGRRLHREVARLLPCEWSSLAATTFFNGWSKQQEMGRSSNTRQRLTGIQGYD
jgi:hypothetical protein